MHGASIKGLPGPQGAVDVPQVVMGVMGVVPGHVLGSLGAAGRVLQHHAAVAPASRLA